MPEQKKHIDNIWIIIGGIASWLIGYGIQDGASEDVAIIGSAMCVLGIILIAGGVLNAIVRLFRQKKAN
jgi:hypothetical protein